VVFHVVQQTYHCEFCHKYHFLGIATCIKKHPICARGKFVDMEKLETIGRFAIVPLGLTLLVTAFVVGACLACVFLAIGIVGIVKLLLANRRL
jgi:hypothetical protein